MTATVFLSKENYDTLDDELHKNFNMEIKDIKNPSNDDRHKYQVRVLPPPRTITLKRVWHEYTLHEKEYSEPVDFKLADADLSKYASIMYERDSLPVTPPSRRRISTISRTICVTASFLLPEKRLAI